MPKYAQKKLQRRPGSLLLPKRLHMMPIVLQKRLQLSKPQRKRLLKKPSALKRRLLLKKPLNKLLLGLTTATSHTSQNAGCMSQNMD